jgi:hypothetical protein
LHAGSNGIKPPLASFTYQVAGRGEGGSKSATVFLLAHAAGVPLAMNLLAFAKKCEQRLLIGENYS